MDERPIRDDEIDLLLGLLFLLRRVKVEKVALPGKGKLHVEIDGEGMEKELEILGNILGLIGDRSSFFTGAEKGKKKKTFRQVLRDFILPPED